MIDLSISRKHFLLSAFFLAILFTCFSIGIETGSIVSKVTSWGDELFIVILFLFVFFKANLKDTNRILFLSMLFIVVGALGNFRYGSGIKPLALGAFSTIKPLLLYYAFATIKFTWDDFWYLMRCFEKFFWIFIIGFAIDIVFPQLGDILQGSIFPNYKHGETRLGIRCIQGFFPRSGPSNCFALVYYIYYKFYIENAPKWRYWIMVLATFVSMKIKDIIALLAIVPITNFRKIKTRHILISGIVLGLLVFAYSILLPDHFKTYTNTSNEDQTARVALSTTGWQIANENFPLGCGFGQFASPTSRDLDSPIYYQYGLHRVYGLNHEVDGGKYMVDTFWPMIIGETGYLGTVLFILILYIVFSPFIKAFIKDTSNTAVVFPTLFFLTQLLVTFAKPALLGPPNSMVLWGFAGIFMSFINNEEDKDE